MPKISLYRPEKGNDFKFIDKQIYNMFQVGGTDILIHKYIGPIDPSDPNKALGESTIQDVLFLENRDRKYDTTIYTLRGVYNVQDIDFNLSQFGLFLQNDTIFMTVHINNTVETLGRKIITGDVVELPHLLDPYALGNIAYALKRFYVVEDVTRAAEGFSVTWYPHLYRLKLKPLVDSQEYKDIFTKPVDDTKFAGEYDDNKTYYPGQIIRDKGKLYEVTAETNGNNPPNSSYFRELDPNEISGSGLSDYLKILSINQGVIAEAESDSPLSGYETGQFWTLQRDDKGNVALTTIDQSDVVIDDANTTDAFYETPIKDGYKGYLTGDGVPPNGAPFGFGIEFPLNATSGDFYLRVDYMPNRLFRFDGSRWVVYEDQNRITMTNNDARKTFRASFINNTEQSNLKMLETDTFYVADPKVFRQSDPTAIFDLMGKKIVTKISYDQKYGVEVYVNDWKAEIENVFEEDNCMAFTLKYSVNVGDLLRWTIYEMKVPQRQSLSKALRPRADF